MDPARRWRRWRSIRRIDQNHLNWRIGEPEESVVSDEACGEIAREVQACSNFYRRSHCCCAPRVQCVVVDAPRRQACACDGYPAQRGTSLKARYAREEKHGE